MTDAERFAFLAGLGSHSRDEWSGHPAAVERVRIDLFQSAKGAACFVSIPGVGERYGAAPTIGGAVDALRRAIEARPFVSRNDARPR